MTTMVLPLSKRDRRRYRSDGNVPCMAINCNRCCYLKTIVLRPDLGDDIKGLNAEWDNDLKKWLMPRKDGHCVYLVDGRCTMYETRPTICRKYDCRLTLATFTKRQLHNLYRTDKVYKRVVASAKKLQANPETALEQTDDDEGRSGRGDAGRKAGDRADP